MHLSDTQRIILNVACQRADRMVLPLPKTLKGGAVTKVIDSLLAKGLIAKVPVDKGVGFPSVDAILWRETENGERLTLVTTLLAFEVLAIEPEGNQAIVEDSGVSKDDSAMFASAPADQSILAGEIKAQPGDTETDLDTSGRGKRETSKKTDLVRLLQRNEGATISEISAVLAWQQHTVRGAIAGIIKKKLGLKVVSKKMDARGRVYRITA
jgi:DNA-binding MarR family transcriptional regulator